jgi:hypothetical protein
MIFRHPIWSCNLNLTLAAAGAPALEVEAPGSAAAGIGFFLKELSRKKMSTLQTKNLTLIFS